MKILVSRLSAMGDVAMLLPILYSVARANPMHEFTLLTQPFFANLLLSPPANLEAMTIDVKGEEQNLWGLCLYAERLREEGFDLYLDLHDVLRTKFFRACLLLSGTKVVSLEKPRAARKNLLLPEGQKKLSDTISMPECYCEVFRRAGLIVPDNYLPLKLEWGSVNAYLNELYPEIFSTNPVVGIAPFASTESKTYDLVLMEQLVERLSRAGIVVYLLGGRGREADILQTWEERYPGVRSLAAKTDLSDELLLISKLRVMVSMDSANMHFASLVGCPVISIWCATHPAAGFLGIGQKREDCLQNEVLSCRPCSIFGQVKRCIKGDMPCRRGVSPEQIMEKIACYIN